MRSNRVAFPRQRTRRGWWSGVAAGIVLGQALAAVLLLAELTSAGNDLSGLGAPLPIVIAVYMSFGVVIGAAAGAGIDALARGDGGWVGPVRSGLLVFVFASMFILRDTLRGELAAFPPELLAVGAVGFVLLAVTVLRVRTRGRGRPRAFRAARTTAVVCVLSLWAGTVLWAPLRHHHVPVRTGAGADAPNILFVLVDALRFDRLSALGYPRPTSPNFDRLASEGVVFTRAYSQGNKTVIAMPSLFTSLYPAFTGVAGHEDKLSPLPEGRTTIAELCRDAGYSTIGMMSNIHVKHPFGLTQGFDRVEEFNPGRFDLVVYRLLTEVGLMRKPQYATATSASATEVTDAALQWLARVPEDAPFFCYVHYMDVHHPYVPPPKYERMFRSREELAAIDPVALFMKTVPLVNERRPYPLETDDLARLSDLYDGCIRYVDAEMGRLVEAVSTTRRGRPTVIVFTADHGDEFQEHGYLYHNNLVIEELIRVPLAIWRSDETIGRRVDELVRHIDVLPTIAEWAGASVPAVAMGRSLVPALSGGASVAASESFAEGNLCSALVEPGWKVMRVDTTDSYELFSLEAPDSTGRPRETSADGERLARMRASLDQYLASADRATGSVTATGETLRQLESLGYIRR